tara:strand:+ start:6333 stop:7307 length:975 start_codon:yes stop_codon:yes gene_type:complete
VKREVFMRFDCYGDTNWFWFLIPGLQQSGMITSLRGQSFRKTLCLYGEEFNVFVDGSDGFAQDYVDPPHQEYCERILRCVQESKGTPYLYFKPWYSPIQCKELEEVAANTGGKIIPFYWPGWPHSNYREFILRNRNELYLQNKSKEKKYDVGMCIKPKIYDAPKPSKEDCRISWLGSNWFGHGAREDTGNYTHDIRVSVPEKLKKSKFSFDHIYDIPMTEFIERSMSWKVHCDLPGIGPMSNRMFEGGWLGQCVVLRKSDVDFPVSWKNYYPEIDYDSDTWEDDMSEIIEDYRWWGDGIKDYLETYCTPEAITNYMIEKIKEGI